MLRFLFLGIILMSSFNSFSQKNVNDYKYVLIPQKFDFLKENDAYQLNSLTKFLFNKHGYKAFIQGENIPEDLAKDGCKALKANLVKGSGLFITKVAIRLTDCGNNIVFTSSEGASREKEFKKGYHEAIRKAFKDVQALNYVYNGGREQQLESNNTVFKDIGAKPKVYKVEEKNTISTTVAVEQPKTEISSKEIPADKPQSVKTLRYLLNEDAFEFKKEEYGYELLKGDKDKAALVGKIYVLKRSNTYLVKAGDLSGAGHFDSYGNFILERVNPITNKLISDIFARQ